MSNAKLLAILDYLEDKIANIELQHGKDGADGKDGKVGPAGPAGKDGKAGKDGVDGRDGKDGKDGVDGKDGEDGVSVVNVEVDIDQHLVVTLSDGRTIDAGSLEALYTGGGAEVFHSSTKVVEAKKTWVDYELNWSEEPVDLGNGKWRYTYQSQTLYRNVPDPYVASDDAFYRDEELTDLVVRRGAI